jgi:hypothetical protein
VRRYDDDIEQVEVDGEVAYDYQLTPAEERKAIAYIVERFHAGDEFVRAFVLEEWLSRQKSRRRDESSQVYDGRRRLRRGHGVRDEGSPAKIRPKP